MLFVLWLIVRLLTRLLVLPNADAGTKDLEILVLRHQLRVLRRKTGRPKFNARDRVLLAAASRVLPRQLPKSWLWQPPTGEELADRVLEKIVCDGELRLHERREPDELARRLAWELQDREVLKLAWKSFATYDQLAGTAR